MNVDIEKERLVLAYKRQLTYLNASLLLGTTGVLSFIGSMLINKNFAIYGLIDSIIIVLIVYIWHNKIDNNLKDISNKMKNL